MSRHRPDLSIVIATRNRKDSLQRLLTSLAACEIRSGKSIEVLVVDNGSGDGTDALVAQQIARSPWTLRYLSEPKTGVCRARNLGIQEAMAPLVAFTDDDCVAEPQWMQTVMDTLDKHSHIDGLFGRVLPLDGRAIDATTVAVKPDPKPREFTWPDSPFVGHGNNMAFRRQALIDVGGFDVQFGPGAPLIAAEDMELTYRLMRSGFRLRYEPEVVLKHAQRDSDEAMLTAHRTNAVGLGAALARHAFRGDLQALKFAYWWRRDTHRALKRARQQRLENVAAVKAVYLKYFSVGLWKGFCDAPRRFQPQLKDQVTGRANAHV